jgi:hypothetical protein
VLPCHACSRPPTTGTQHADGKPGTLQKGWPQRHIAEAPEVSAAEVSPWLLRPGEGGPQAFTGGAVPALYCFLKTALTEILLFTVTLQEGDVPVQPFSQ